MIFDNQSLLSDAQAITASAASTNVIDLGATGRVYGAAVNLARDIGKGCSIPLLIQVIEAFTASGSATLQFSLEVDDNESFSSAKTVWQSRAIGKAELVQGFIVVPEYITRGTDERYARLYYTVATGPMTAGKVTAGVTMGNQSNG
ncbi:Bbp16 family capsid cement protein [Hyphomicrobium sp. 99]|uniref:Bbp16 family capsid cement protein n=1 Tax=Hyphomicrobium sp. 99 TaxID=1163419 RepID=UPI0005F86AC7|nr:hypothetical protein [Hyphomicrobium sp. 99]